MATPQRFVGVAGLPWAGSTLLCQLLGAHPDIHCEGHSSPLCNSLLAMRSFISDDPFFLAQNRAWMHCIEFLLHLNPEARVIVPIR